MENENLNVEQVEETPIRAHPFCVISKGTFGSYAVHDIQTCTAWSANPYGEDYAVVPDKLVPAVMDTGGFLEPVWNENGTELSSFTAREKPEIAEPEEPEVEPTVWDELDAAYQEGVNGAYDQ